MNTCAIIFLLTLGTQNVFGNGRIALNNYQRKDCPKFDDPNVNLQLPHESDCTLFYHCSNGEKHLTRCPAGLHFNPETETCDYPGSAGCIHIGTTSTISTSIATENPPTSTASVGVTASTSETAQITSSTASATSTSVTSTTASPSTASVTSTSVTSTTASPSTASEYSSTGTTSASTVPEGSPASCPAVDPDAPVLLPHECACQKYYLCSGGFQILQRCPVNFHFSPSTRKCDTPENARCSEMSSTSGASPSTPSTLSTLPSSTPTRPASSTSSSDSPVTPSTSSNSPVTPSTSSDSSVTPSTTPIPVIPTECPPTNEGNVVHLPHKTDCSLFYKCDFGEKVVQECPARLKYNALKQVCDYPSNIDCSINFRP